MAGKQQVTLTFAGDSDRLTSAFDRVGAGAQSMSASVDRSSRAMAEHGNSLNQLADKADNSERNLIGVHDVIDGTATIMQGPGKAGIVAYVQGWADLAGGVAPLIAAMSTFSLETVRSTAAMVGAKVGMVAHAAAAGIATAAQWAWNVAMTANPIGIIIVAIAALVAAIVFIAVKTDWFQRAWRAAWGWIKDTAIDVWNWLKELPDRIGGVFSRVAAFITAPWRAAFNFIASAWNATVGSLSWSVPSWVPVIGGNSISAPRLPHFHSGGLVPGAPGSEMLAVLQAGERVIPANSSGGGTVRLTVTGGGDSQLATFLHSLARQGILQFELAG